MSQEIALPQNIMTSQRMLEQKYAPQTTDDALGRDAFLKLFTTQLKSQDPLSPMANEAFVSQLAQFSSLESMKAMQTSIEDMSKNMLGERLMSGTSMLGRSIPSLSGTTVGGGGRLTQVGADLPQGADSVTFTIKNSAGELVYEELFGRQPASEMKFQWDGNNSEGEPQPLGLYYVTVNVGKGSTQWAAPVTTQELISAVRWDEAASGIVVETETGREINLAQLNRIEL